MSSWRGDELSAGTIFRYFCPYFDAILAFVGDDRKRHNNCDDDIDDDEDDDDDNNNNNNNIFLLYIFSFSPCIFIYIHIYSPTHAHFLMTL